MGNNRERVLSIAAEMLALKQKLAGLEAELGSLVPEDVGPGRPKSEEGTTIADRILAELRTAEVPLTVKGLTGRLGAKRKTVSALLTRLVKQGAIERVAQGEYRAR